MRRLLTSFAFASLMALPAVAGPNEDALIAADKAFNEMAQKDGIAKAFEAYAAPDARQFNGDEKPMTGPSAIKSLMEASYPPGSTLSWAPVEAVSSVDGTMGFTHGRWTFVTPKDEKGQTHSLTGSYATVWQKQPDGAYKFTVDIGNPDKPKK